MKKLFFSTRLVAVLLVVVLSSGYVLAQTQDALVSHIDSTVRAGDNFFMFANGRWFKEHVIPSSEQSNGIFQTIQDTINAQVHDVCVTSTVKKNVKGSARQKIGDLYYTGMDSVTLNQKGISPLKPEIERINRIQNVKELMQEVAYLNTLAVSPMFNFLCRTR
jgi:putative endopeptidase